MSIFAPLHIITGYTFLESGLTIEKIAQSVKKQDYYGAGITDNALFGAHEFFNNIKGVDKKPVLGFQIKIDEDNLSVFVINEDGYKNLLRINYLIQKEQFSIKELKNLSNGLIGVIETKYGNFRKDFLEFGEDSKFTKYLLNIADSFKENFYLGLEVTSKEDVKYANSVRKFADKFTYKCVAFPRIKYCKKEDAVVLDIVNAIKEDTTITIKSSVGQEYFMIENDYRKIYSTTELKNTIEIIDLCSFDINLKRGTLLKFTENTSNVLLKEHCEANLKRLNINDQTHIDRLNYELSVIEQMGYCDYFLLVEDYVKWAKEHEVLVGPGRGSSAGSLVAYLLNITEIDPLDYNLQFERFLNPARSTMPDIDVDFMDIKRDTVVDYMREKYGQNRVGSIVTFQHIMAKQSLRDIQKVYNYPKNHIDLLCKSIPSDNHSKDITLREAYKKDEKFRSLIDSDKYFLEIVSLASKIEGLPRQAGMHPAGIVLNDNPLEESMPVTVDFDGNYISQYEMDYLEGEGFLKMDFLSLRNLTVIDLAVKLINLNHPELNLDPDKIPYEAPEIFEIIRNRHTMGIFQLESAGMKRAIKILKPNCFEDIVALLALFRPGPMDSIKDYASYKEGKKKITYISESLKEVLAPTYGIIIYQEQINKIAQVMAGFSPSEADIFRRAISKKEKEKILKAKEKFIKGSLANGYKEKEVNDVFNLILKFADYGFNKSHSVVYSIIACRLAWLKAFYPLEFYSAILEIGSSVTDSKFNEYVAELKARDFKIFSPNINESKLVFSIKEGGLLFPLSSIHDVNATLNNAVINERKNGEFKDLFDFISRMFEYGITEKNALAYINSGALDCLNSSRASMRVSLKGALQFAQLNHSDNGQLSLGISEYLKPRMTKATDDPIENLNFEYEAIKIMLSDNPLRYKRDILKNKDVTSIVDLDEDGQATVAGIIKSKKPIQTRKGESMCFIKIFDETSEIEITIFPRVYSSCYQFIEKDKFILIKGKVETDEEDKSIIADSVELLEEQEDA